MTKITYSISGMTCSGCSASIKNSLENDDRVVSANVSHMLGTAEIVSDVRINLLDLQKIVAASGPYSISNYVPEEKKEHVLNSESEQADTSTQSYKPLVLLVLFIAGISFLAHIEQGFDGMLWMRYFMAGFFLAFSFFKFLDVPAFASSFARYDLIAMRWKGYGMLYPYIELFLGLAYLVNASPAFVNTATFLVMGIGLLGVWQSVRRKDQIQCACLGTVFNLPMSTVTVVENLSMMLMALVMLLA